MAANRKDDKAMSEEWKDVATMTAVACVKVAQERVALDVGLRHPGEGLGEEGLGEEGRERGDTGEDERQGEGNGTGDETVEGEAKGADTGKRRDVQEREDTGKRDDKGKGGGEDTGEGQDTGKGEDMAEGGRGIPADIENVRTCGEEPSAEGWSLRPRPSHPQRPRPTRFYLDADENDDPVVFSPPPPPAPEAGVTPHHPPPVQLTRPYSAPNDCRVRFTGPPLSCMHPQHRTLSGCPLRSPTERTGHLAWVQLGFTQRDMMEQGTSPTQHSAALSSLNQQLYASCIHYL